MSQLGIWSITDAGPVRSDKVRIGLERYLEDWIERDPQMLPEDLTIVGRQVTLGEHRLDLLAISRTGQWVVIELKEGELYRETLMQVLDYTAKVAVMPADDLLRKLNRGDDVARGRAAELLAAETGVGIDGAGGTGGRTGRDVVAMVVGTMVNPGLERMVTFLGGYSVPIRMVTFDVFDMAGGGRLLVREVEDTVETGEASALARTTYSVAAVRDRALGLGSGDVLDVFIEAGRDLGLHIRAWKLSITLNPPEKATRTFFYAKPESDGRLLLGYDAANLTDLCPLSAEDVEATVGRFANWGTFGPADVRAFVGAMGELMRNAQDRIGGASGP